MTDSISLNNTINSVSVVQVTNSITAVSPGPQGPAGTFTMGSLVVNDPITNISGSLGYNASYLVASATNSSSANFSLNSASLGGISASDYALDTSSNTFTGTQTILTGASANKGLIVRATASQTANLQEWQNASGSALAVVGSSGQATFDANGVINLSLSVGNALAIGTAYSVTRYNNAMLSIGALGQVGAVIRSSTTQAADLFQLQNSSGSAIGGRNAIGQIYTGSTQPILTALSSSITNIAASVSANASITVPSHTLLAGQVVYVTGVNPSTYNGTWNVLSVPTASVFTIGNTTGSARISGGSVSLAAQTSIISTASNTKSLIVRAASGNIANSSGTTPMMEWQDGAGTVVGRVEFPGGNLRWDYGIRTDRLLGSSDALTVARILGSQNIQLGGGSAAIGSGAGVIGITNASAVPSANPSGGGILYVDSGSLKYRGPSGTITTLAVP